MNAVKREFDEAMSFDGKTGFSMSGLKDVAVGYTQPVSANSVEATRTETRKKEDGMNMQADAALDGGVSFLGAALGMPGLSGFAQAAQSAGDFREENVQAAPRPQQGAAMRAQAQNDNTSFNRWELSVKSNRSSFIMSQNMGPKPSDSDGVTGYSAAPVMAHNYNFTRASGPRLG